MLSEYDFYNEIIGDLFRALEKGKNLELWKANSILKLMDYFKDSDDNNIIEKGLINILFLADNFEDFEYRGEDCRDIHNLDEIEKSISIELLKSEFIQ